MKGIFSVTAILVCSLLLSYAAKSQTYNNVTNLSGTSTVAGVNVTVTSAGVFSSFSCAGLSQPYLEGQDLSTSAFGVGSYTWSLSAPASAIRIHMESIDVGDDVTITINGLTYNITAANISPLVTTSTCLGSTGTAVAFAGNLVYSSGGGSNSATLDIAPGFGINTVTIQSLGAGAGVINDFSFAVNANPVFVNGAVQLFSVCESSTANSINTMLATSDADAGQTLTWSVTTAPMHGTLGGFPVNSTSTGGTVTPTGLSYTPSAGFSGFDTFYVQVSDGIATANATLVVTVNPTPTLSSSTTILPICDGSVLSYTPTSPIAGTAFNWTRPFVGGISNAAGSGMGNPNEVLNNATYYNVSVTYIYILTAAGCSDTGHVSVIVKPTPRLNSQLSDTLCNGDTLNYVPTSGTTGTAFTWSRPSVAGISPATSSGTGTIHEQLTNSTTAPLSTTYHFGLNAAGCTSLEDVMVTVNPPIAGVPITTMPASSLCGGTVYQNFGASTAPGIGVIYTWTAVNATVVNTGNNGQYALVSFPNPGNAIVTLNTSVPGSPCLSTSNYNVSVTIGENPSATIIYYQSQFVYLDNTDDTYQWGYDAVGTLAPTTIAGAEFQSYPSSLPDFTDNYYWVKTTKNGCSQKTYYNPPLAVQNIQNNGVLKIYPNPANNIVTIAITGSQGNTNEVSIINMLGQTVKRMASAGQSMQFDIADMPAGIYLVNCTQNGAKVATGRFIKN